MQLALGWAAWKTYLGRPETDGNRFCSMELLGNALRPSRPEEALPVLEASLALYRRYWSHDERGILIAQNAVANCLYELGREDEALDLEREIYARDVAMHGADHQESLVAANNIIFALVKNGSKFDEARAFGREQVALARRALGADNSLTLSIEQGNARSQWKDPDATRETLRAVAKTLQDLIRRQRRVLGANHPELLETQQDLSELEARLASLDGA